MAKLDRSAFLAIFKKEADEHIQKLNQGLLTLESNPEDRTVLEEIARSAHTLKGSARMIGLTDINEIAHKMEDILVEAKDGRLSFDDAIFDLLFETLDTINLLLESKPESGIEVSALLKQLEKASRGEEFESRLLRIRVPLTRERKPSEETVPEEPAALAPEETVTTEPDSPTTSAVRKEVEVVQPSVATAPEETVRVGISKLDILGSRVGELLVNQVKSETQLSKFKQITNQLRAQAKLWAQIKNQLLNESWLFASSEELVAESSASFRTCIDEFERINAASIDSILKLFQEYNEDVTQTGLTVQALQDDVMDLRMFPVSTIFDAFPRAVRDLSKEYKKEIDLVIEGAETELDKRIIEGIRDALMHLIRNAVDHGIEPPEERVKAGKTKIGKITLSAYQEGDKVIIEVKDDGRGIDLREVKATAVKKGLITQVESDAMADEEALRLIFEAGLSTRSEVTDVSGRGVGLDVVRRSIEEELKGQVEIESEIGKGTKILLSLPLTLAIIRVLLVNLNRQPPTPFGKGDGSVLAIPITSIETVIKIQEEEIRTVDDKGAIIVRGKIVPLVRLEEILQLQGSRVTNNESMPVVVVSHGQQQIGFAVDSFIGEQEVVIKSLGSHLRKVRNVAGAAILGTGDVVIILHVPNLINSAKAVSGKRIIRESILEERTAGRRSILIVEDSLITRELEKSILESSGYEVDIAVDGLDGLNKVAEKKFDLIISDVQMPRMDGFEFTKRLKRDERYKDIPVVIVTALEKDEEKRRGLEVGAAAYMVKTAFDQTSLLNAIESLIG